METLQVARADGVVTATLDRPAEKNAVNDVMWQALEDEGRCQTVNFGTTDTAEAMAAFLQKREPRFTGK